MTYSIVARDRATGHLGVAVQTCNLAVGNWVPWAQAGVGAVATQSHADRSYGTLGLALMAGGKDATAALSALRAADEGREFRQVAMIDHHGQVAVFTGSRCLAQAGHRTGDGFSVQANMMASDTVWDAMADAYTAGSGDLAERLLAALHAAQAAGGDMRGQQTAALLVVDSQRSPYPLVDLRVDRAERPLDELDQLLRLHRAYAAEYTIPDLADAGLYDEALHRLAQIAEWAPEQEYLHFLRAYHLAGRLDRWAEALEIMQGLTTANPVWIDYLRREGEANTFDQPGLAARFLQALAFNDSPS